MPEEAAGASEPPTGGLEKLHLDEVSGKMVSKSELKRLQKQRKTEEEKQKKAAAAPQKPAKAEKKRPAEEMELNPNVSFRNLNCAMAYTCSLPCRMGLNTWTASARHGSRSLKSSFLTFSSNTMKCVVSRFND